MTPDEWRNLDPRDAMYLWTAQIEYNQRHNEEHEKQVQKINQIRRR